MIRTRSNLSPVGFRVGHVPLNVNTIILTAMKAEVSVTAHQAGDHAQTVLPEWRGRFSSPTCRHTNAVRQSLSFLSSLVLSVSSLHSKIKQGRLPCAWFNAGIRSDQRSSKLQTRLLTFSFRLFFFFLAWLVSQFEGKTITRALHFGSDKGIKSVLSPYYYHVSWLFTTSVYAPKSSSSMSSPSVVSCDNYLLPTSLIAD